MFASAIYDSRSESVRLVRDRTGQKPLFYALLGNHTIIYSSSIHAITASGIVPVELSQHELSFILFNEYPAPGTTGIEGIQAVRPGEVVKWLIDDYEVKKTTFWNWNLARSEYESKEANIQASKNQDLPKASLMQLVKSWLQMCLWDYSLVAVLIHH